MIVIVNMLITFLGFGLYAMSYIEPRFKLLYLDFMALFVMAVPWVLDIYTMKKEDTFIQTDRIPKWKTIIDFIDRNRDVHSVIADRPYHAMSFLECRGLGLLENKGKDSVLKKGSKKYVLALENCEHTPDPDNMLASEILWELGIRDSYTLKKLLLGQFLDAGDYKIMGQVLVQLKTYHLRHGGYKLIREWESSDSKNIEFEQKKTISKDVFSFDKISQSVDNILSRKGEK